jgi:hypothetical protein
VTRPARPTGLPRDAAAPDRAPGLIRGAWSRRRQGRPLGERQDAPSPARQGASLCASAPTCEVTGEGRHASRGPGRRSGGRRSHEPSGLEEELGARCRGSRQTWGVKRPRTRTPRAGARAAPRRRAHQEAHGGGEQRSRDPPRRCAPVQRRPIGQRPGRRCLPQCRRHPPGASAPRWTAAARDACRAGGRTRRAGIGRLTGGASSRKRGRVSFSASPEGAGAGGTRVRRTGPPPDAVPHRDGMAVLPARKRWQACSGRSGLRHVRSPLVPPARQAHRPSARHHPPGEPSFNARPHPSFGSRLAVSAVSGTLPEARWRAEDCATPSRTV